MFIILNSVLCRKYNTQQGNLSENISLTDMTTVKIEQKSVNISQNSDIEQRSKIEAHDAG